MWHKHFFTWKELIYLFWGIVLLLFLRSLNNWIFEKNLYPIYLLWKLFFPFLWIFGICDNGNDDFRKYWKDLSLWAVDICTRRESYSLLVVVLETEPRTLWPPCVRSITKLYSTVRLGAGTGRRGPKGQRTFIGGMRIRGDDMRMVGYQWK